MQYFIGFKEHEFKANNPWLKGAMISLVQKDFQSWFQEIYFRFNKSRPSIDFLRRMFPTTTKHLFLLGKKYEEVVSYEITRGFFERLLYSEDEIFSGPKKSLIFYKIDAKKNISVVDQVEFVQKKKKIKALLKKVGIRT